MTNSKKDRIYDLEERTAKAALELKNEARKL